MIGSAGPDGERIVRCAVLRTGSEVGNKAQNNGLLLTRGPRRATSSRGRTLDVEMNKRIAKIILGVIAALAGIVIVTFAIAFISVVIPPGENTDKESGYYGEFNRILHSLERMTNITVVDSWMNKDITLEEMGFTLQTDQGQQLKISFGERNPIRKLRNQKLDEALRTMIEEEQNVQQAGGAYVLPGAGKTSAHP